MEKIAIISDIHGNITALNEVLKDIEKRGIKKIMCLGDMVIKCSSPRECVEKVFSKCEVVIKGNCEERVASCPKIEEHFWNQRKLTKEQLEKVEALPLSHDFYMSGYKIRIMHASPYSIKEKSYYWDFDEEYENRIDNMFKNTEYLNNIGEEKPDIVVFGHIHKPFLYRKREKVLINPGAISNTSDVININGKKYTFGSYLILEGEMDSKKLSKISYKIVKFPYDYMKEVQNILDTDMPNKELAAEEIRTGKYFNRKQIIVEAEMNKWKK